MEGPFLMVVLIVLIAVGAGVVNNYLKLQAKRSEGASDAEIQKMQADIDRLTERVRVLEKIATDGDHRLRDEISRLA